MKKVILITGVSSGFGRATSRLLASTGYTVYGTIRSKVDVPDDVVPLLMDLTDIKSIKAAVDHIALTEGHIDVLINNAAMHTGGPIEEISETTLNKQISTNLTGQIILTQEVLSLMRPRKTGTIINISSIGGLMGLPFQGIYSTTKFAIEGLSEALRLELKPFNIRVIVINPGDFATNNTVNRKIEIKQNSPYYQYFEKAIETIAHDETNGWKPERLAQLIGKIIEKDNLKSRYIIGAQSQKFAVFLKKILPAQLFSKILGSYYGIR